MSPDYKDPRPIPLAYVYMLGQFRAPRTGRLYRSASPGARYQRRYTTNGTVMPREKLKLRGKPGEREREGKELTLSLTNAQLGTRQLENGAVRLSMPILVGDIVELYGLYHFRQWSHGPRGIPAARMRAARSSSCRISQCKYDMVRLPFSNLPGFAASLPRNKTSCANFLFPSIQRGCNGADTTETTSSSLLLVGRRR
jgi:hypothetical protein